MKEMTNGALYDVVTDATGNHHSMSNALEYVAFSGALVYVGITTQEISFIHPALHRREIDLLASRNALPEDFPRIIRLIEEGTINTDPWITHRIKMDQVADQFESLIQPESGVLKAIIEVGD
jgi:alcohol dehydrogenase